MFEGINLDNDILDLDTAKNNLDKIVEEVALEHSHKIIIRNNKPAAILVNASDYQALQNRLFAIEFENGIREMKEEEARGELYDWDELLDELDIQLSDNYEKPEGYDSMIPEKYRNVS